MKRSSLKDKTVESLAATSGVAVERAKRELDEAINVRLSFDYEAKASALLGKLLKTSPRGALARLHNATLAELKQWTAAIELATPSTSNATHNTPPTTSASEAA